MTQFDLVVEQLDGLAAALETFGPWLELDRRWRTGEAGLEGARATRAAIQELLDSPRCPYDDAVLRLTGTLLALGTGERLDARELVGPDERQALRPYAVRAPFLALEGHSSARLASGLLVNALVAPDGDDPRDVMIELAPARAVADELGLNAAELFAEAATFAAPALAETFESFGRRTVTLGAFGWQRVDTPAGPRFRFGA